MPRDDSQRRWVGLIEKGSEMQDAGLLSQESVEAMNKIVDTYLVAVELDTKVRDTSERLGWSRQRLLGGGGV